MDNEQELKRAYARFSKGDRVSYPERGWAGTVSGEPSDRFIIWCDFDNVGQFGADPRKLFKAKGTPHV